MQTFVSADELGATWFDDTPRRIMKRRGSREKPPHGVLGLVGYTHALLGCDSLPHALARRALRIGMRFLINRWAETG